MIELAGVSKKVQSLSILFSDGIEIWVNQIIVAVMLTVLPISMSGYLIMSFLLGTYQCVHILYLSSLSVEKINGR